LARPFCLEQFAEDRCFRADGFYIREKATTRTNVFIARAGFGNAAAGKPRLYTDKHPLYKNAISE